LVTPYIELSSKTRDLKTDGRKARSYNNMRKKKRKQLFDYLKKRRGYWNLKEETLDSTLWRTRFGRGYSTDVRQKTT
jgi:hypothetical protein